MNCCASELDFADRFREKLSRSPQNEIKCLELTSNQSRELSYYLVLLLFSLVLSFFLVWNFYDAEHEKM
jgi:hypothetical protein